MKIGERIKKRRSDLGMSADDLAKKIGKNRATIYRYENEEIEKLPTNVLVPLAIALNTTPAYLMGWETETVENEPELIDTDPTIEMYNKLNPLGKRKASDYIQDLSEQEKYTKPIAGNIDGLLENPAYRNQSDTKMAAEIPVSVPPKVNKKRHT